MSRDKRHLVLTAISVCAACALMATPASADDGKGGGGGRSGGGGGGGDNRGRVTTTTTTSAPPAQRDDRGRGDDHAKPAANPIPQVVHVERQAEHEVEHVAAPPVVNVVVDNDRDRDNRGPGNAFDRDDNRGPGNARDRDADDVAAVATVNDLVTAINNEVATLTNANAFEVEEPEEVNEANEVEVEHLRVISLASLTAGLSAADAAAITNAVNANTAGLQTFLGSGGANANAIDNALNAAGIAPSSVLAILGDGEHLVVVTA
jgi:hypothetical protein